MTTKVYLSKEDAEKLAEKIRQELPGVRVSVASCTRPDTGEIIGWFLGLFVEDNCIVAVDDEQDYDNLKKFCLYVSEQLDNNCFDTYDMSFSL